MRYRLHGHTLNLSQLKAHCDDVRERCRRQRVTMLLEREALRMAAMLHDHETRLKRAWREQAEIDRVVRPLLEGFSE